jgi:small subunit ribosomal protein S18
MSQEQHDAPKSYTDRHYPLEHEPHSTLFHRNGLIDFS